MASILRVKGDLEQKYELNFQGEKGQKHEKIYENPFFSGSGFFSDWLCRTPKDRGYGTVKGKETEIPEITVFDVNSGEYQFDDRIAREIMKQTGVKIQHHGSHR